MSYVVNWQGGDGAPGWHSVAELTEAAAHVEQLRNTEGVDGAKIYRLEEVAFELRPYFRVELAPASVFTPSPAPAAEPAMPVHADESWADAAWVDAQPAATKTTETTEASEAAAVLEPAGDGGSNGVHRRGLFGR